MEARCLRFLVPALFLGFAAGIQAETIQTRNFLITADSADIARQVGDAAEEYRRQLAIFWLGEPLPNWSRPCRLRVRAGALGASGQTTFQFVRGEVVNWNMFVQGSLERILDSVLPHEINHTIFACHFRRPLPRWADEGAATLFEHESEQAKQLALLKQVIRQGRENFSLKQLLTMKEYPEGMRPMLILYSQGYALADFLVQQKGRHTYLQFLSDGERIGWEQAIQQHFDHEGVESLESNWKGWVMAGMPKLTLPPEQQVASTSAGQSTARPDLQVVGGGAPVVRSQSPDERSDAEPSAVPEVAAVEDTADWSRAAQPSASTSSLVHAVEQGAATPTVGKTRPVAVNGPRHQTLEAPRPRVRPAPASAADRQPQTKTGAFTETGAGGTLDSVFRQRDESVTSGGFQPTASSTRRSSRDRGPADPFSSPASLQPRKRVVESGTVPQWAGFPGQPGSF